MRTPLSDSSSSWTVSLAKPAMSLMNCLRESSPRSILPSRCSQLPVSPGEVSAWWLSRRTTFRPFSVATSARPSRSRYPTWIRRSMIAERVAGVPMPESFIASRSSSSSTSLPAVSIAASSDASL